MNYESSCKEVVDYLKQFNRGAFPAALRVNHYTFEEENGHEWEISGLKSI